MRRFLALSLLFAASRAFAGAVGAADAHAVAATGFPGAYLTTVQMSLSEDALYGSRFLDAFQTQLQAVTSMTAPRAVAAYLEQSSTAGEGLKDLRAKLGREALPPPQAASLLIANALARPEQFREVMDGLETMKPGMGLHAARMLRDAKGEGDKRLIAVLRQAGARRPQGEGLTYGADGRWATMFDGSPAVHDDAPSGTAVSVPAVFTGSPDSRPRASRLLPAERP